MSAEDLRIRVKRLATRNGIEWDGHGPFADFCDEVVGKRHLDEMGGKELEAIAGAIKDGGGPSSTGRHYRKDLSSKTIPFEEALALEHFMVWIDRPIGFKPTTPGPWQYEYPVNYGEAMGRNNIADNWDWDCLVPGIVVPRRRILVEKVVGWVSDSKGNHKLIGKPYGVSVDDPVFQGQVQKYVELRRRLEPKAEVHWLGQEKTASLASHVVRILKGW